MTASGARGLRVYYITPGGTAGRGGMGGVARYLTAAIGRLDPSVTCRVLDSYGPGPFWKMPFHFAATALCLFWACLWRRVDVVHLHMSFGGSAMRKMVLLLIAERFGVATVVHLHGSKFEDFVRGLRPWLRRGFIRILSRASRLVVIGDYWKDYLVAGLGIAEGKIATIYNGVPIPPLKDANERDGRDAPLIATAGLLGPRKGTPDLLKALAEPSLRDLPWRAVLAGNGALAEAQAEAAALGLADRVTFPGWVDGAAIARLLGQADIFVLPSHNEGLPVAILEAMAAGLPVVTTPVGAIGEAVIDGETGLVVPPGAVGDLSAALATLVRDGEARARLGAAGRRRAEELFSIDVAAARVLALYAEVARGAPGD